MHWKKYTRLLDMVVALLATVAIVAGWSLGGYGIIVAEAVVLSLVLYVVATVT